MTPEGIIIFFIIAAIISGATAVFLITKQHLSKPNGDEQGAREEVKRKTEQSQKDALDARRYRALKKWHDSPNIPEFNLDEVADALLKHDQKNRRIDSADPSY